MSNILAWENTHLVHTLKLRKVSQCTSLQFNIMKHQEWTSDTRYELLVYKLILWPLGLWPLNKGEMFSELRLYLNGFMMTSVGVSLVLEMWNNCREIEVMLDLFIASGYAVLGICKGLLARHHLGDLKDNLTSAIMDWRYLSQNYVLINREVMMKYARLSRLTCLSVMTTGIGGCVMWTIISLPAPVVDGANNSDPIRNFPAQTVCIFASLTTSRFYYIICMVQVSQILLVGITNCGNDALFFGLAMHICGQLEILQNHFSNIEIGKDEVANRKKIKVVTDRHVDLIELVKKLDSAFSMILLIQLMMSCVMICVMGVQVIFTLKLGDVRSATKGIIILVSLFPQLFLYSYAGDCLTSENTSLVFAIYGSSWYETLPTAMKSVVFIMMRANKPIYITAGKFFCMNVPTFLDIIKASASYISVLRLALDV